MNYLEKLKWLCEGATEGPWRGDGLKSCYDIQGKGGAGVVTGPWIVDYFKEGERQGMKEGQVYIPMNDRLFILESRTALPWLRDMVEKLQGYTLFHKENCQQYTTATVEVDMELNSQVVSVDHVCDCGLDSLLTELRNGPEAP